MSNTQEQTNTKTVADQLIEFIGENTQGTLTLVPARFGQREEGKVYPMMRGWLDTPLFRVPAAAFLKSTDEGREYLSISFGNKGDLVYGCLFRVEEQDMTNGKWVAIPGKENDRTGLISKSIQVGEKDGKPLYEKIFELRMIGGIRKTRNGNHCIKVKVFSAKQNNERLGIF